ncbi:MAG: chitobiase/beta-hexosaminidase C-terminal domain-containing protein [Paludibacteraceae bacterium]|nr:chitobiase/beta-hexosaminidase C-terminal domain-containing protein [Paludibacteraceae bacterium]
MKNIYLHRIWILISVLILTISHTFATDVTISVANDTWTSTGTSGTGGTTSVTKSGITVSSTKGFKDGTTAIREYSGCEITVSSSVGNITKIAFTSTASGTSNNGPSKISLKSGQSGSYSYSGKVGTWTYATGANSVVFSASAQFRWTQVVVTYSGGTTYTVTYNANGGSGSMSNGTGASVTIADCSFTAPSGKTFSKWNTNSNGTGTDYAVGASVTQNLNLYAIWIDIPQYTVNWYVNGSVAHSQTGYEGATLTSIPTPTSSDCDGSKSFVGWTSTANYSHASTAPAFVSPTTIPNGGANYYAVFATASAGGTTEWVETAIEDISGSDIFVIATPGGYAVSNNNGTSSAPSAVSITVSAGKITSTVTDEIKWNLGGNSTDGYIFYPNGSTTTWLYCSTTATSGSNNNIRVGTGDRKHWKADNDGDYATNDNYTDRWLCNYNDADFRGYVGSSVTSDIVSKFYKKSGGTSYSDYETNCCTPLGQINGPINLTQSGAGIAVSWTSGVSDATGYLVKVYEDNNGSKGNYLDVSATTSGQSDTTVTITNAAIVAGSKYWVGVTPLDNSGTYCPEGKERISASSITMAASACAAPTFSLTTGTTYDNSQTLTISTSTDGANILYTTNGTDPTCSSGSTYSSAITVDGNQTVKAIACKDGLDASAVASATYSFKCATPTFSVAAGTYSSTQSVTLSCETTDAVIHYTTDGSTPTGSSPTYSSSAITVDDDMTIKAIAIKTNYTNSDVASATYRIMNCDWYESFDQCDGQGGNGGNWSGYSSTAAPTYDNSGWTINAGAYKGNKCIKAGSGNTGGTATTPTITVDNGVTGRVSFRTGAWDSGSAKLTFTGAIVGTSGTTTTWTAASEMTASQWNDYEVEFTTTSTSLQIEFSSTGNRFWLDEVCVKLDPASYTVTFNANGHGTAPDPITDVAKNSTINSSKPSDPTATGWTFGGWYKEEGCTNAWNWNTDQVTENTTLYAKWTCSKPTSLSISSTGSKYDFCAGESMTLTVSGSNIGDGATYQWKLGGADISGATSASYTTTMAAAKAGEYTCKVSNGTCSDSTSGSWVRVWTLYINNGAAGAWQELDFTNTGTNAGSNTTVELSADGTYQFKLKDNNDGWFGLNSKTITGTESNIALNGTGANVNLNAGLGGYYTFTINYSTPTAPQVSVTYPTANQAADYPIYFDKSVITGWNSEDASDIYLRIGKSGNNKNNITDSKVWTLVPGTDRFYQTVSLAYNGFEAWQIANNTSWSGDNSIYKVDGSGYAITKGTEFQKYVVESAGVTIIPNTPSTGQSDGCDYFSVTKTDGMLKHTATITAPTNGTISLAYTSKAGSPSTATVSDLPHRSYITATATPAAGYQLATFTVTPEGGDTQNLTSGAANNHVLATNATFAATFSEKTITITWNGNGGTPSKASDTWVYNSSALASLPTASGNGSKIFVGWFTDPTAGTQIDNVGGSNKPTDNVTYYAHWSDGNTVYFHASPGTASVDSVTQTTIGSTVTLATATIDCEGWTFAGWKVGSAQTETTTDPEAGLLASGASYTPASATVQMYAVWKKNFGGGTGDVTSTYDWDNNTTGWTTAGTTQNNGGVDNSNYASLGGTGYMTYNSQVKVKGLSFAFKLSSNNTKGTIKVQKATNSTFSIGLTDVRTWTISEMSALSSSWKTYSTEVSDFDGATNYYVRLAYIQEGNSNAIRYFDDIVVTYTGTIPDSYKWTSTPDDYGCTPANQVKTPVISPDTVAQTGDVSVSITCATDDATIRYTTDGTDPTKSSGTVYSGAFTVSCSATVKAIAYKADMDDSEIASQAYTITVPTPTFSLAEGTYYDADQTLTLLLPTTHTGTVIKYTTNGDDPTSSSTTYSSALTLTEGSHTIKAIGYNATCGTSSAVATATYNIRFGETYTLVTDVNNLNPGDKIVIIGDVSDKKALSTYNISGNNRSSTYDFNWVNDATKTEAKIYPAFNDQTTVQVIDLEGEPGAWVLKAENNDTKKYLGLNSDNNYLKTYTANSDSTTKWTISISSNIATIQNNAYTERNIQLNTSGTPFAAYKSGTQDAVKIYSLPNPNPVIKVEATLSAFSACQGIAGDAQSFYISGKNLDGNLVISGAAGYEFCLTENGTYAATLTLTPSTKTVARTQVYVRLSATAAAGAHNGNLNAAVSVNSLSQDIAVTDTVSVADMYVDRIHNQVISNQCGTYSAPTLADTGTPSDESCVETHYKFMGWVSDDAVADGFNSDSDYIADLITAATSMTADGTTYYAVWAKEE